MPIEMPPSVPAVAAHYAPAPECRYLSTADAEAALRRIRGALPGTAFSGAKPSEVCGMIRLEMASGKFAYTDPTGRYLMLAFAIDTHRGEPADNDAAVERAVDARSQFPKEAIPGVLPRPAPVEGDLMSPIPTAPQKQLPLR